MNIDILNKDILETIEYYINYNKSYYNSYDEVIDFIKKSIVELGMNEQLYLSKNNITTKTNITYYLKYIKKINLDSLRETFTEMEINDMMEYCSRLSYIKNQIIPTIMFSQLLEYYYVAKLYFYKNVLIKCLEKYIGILEELKNKSLKQ